LPEQASFSLIILLGADGKKKKKKKKEKKESEGTGPALSLARPAQETDIPDRRCRA